MSTPPQGPDAGERTPIWRPDPERVAGTRIAEFAAFTAARTGTTHDSYSELWRWSVEDLDGFWAAVWDFFEIESGTPYRQVLDTRRMPGGTWFGGATVNYAEHALRHGVAPGMADKPALICVGEHGPSSALSWRELRRQVGALAQWLRGQEIGPGDRVVGYLPNTEHAIVAFLATASIGAVWSGCAQDYGAAGAAARLGQLEPKILFAADGYRWGGKEFDRRDEVADLARRMPTVRATVLVPNLGLAAGGLIEWSAVTAGEAEPSFERVDFGAPLWVLFSSGTTGIPKGIVHGHGGVLLDHHRLLGLHNDLRPGDRFFWYTTTNWMMWNLVASGLLVGATTVLYDGSPAHLEPQRLWQIAADHEVKVFGTSPGYLLAGMKAGIEPGQNLDLSALHTVGSTGAPLPAQCYQWVRDHVGADVQLASTSGGTDIVSGFAGSAPTTDVWPGELSAPLLGVALAAWNDRGVPVLGAVGELVVTAPMPSMPIYFWGDPDGAKYRDAYFADFPGVWRHGDWVTVTARGSLVISGRSDSTLNRQGVRLGSADIYDVVEDIPEIAEALVIGVELADGGYWMPLFVRLADGAELDDRLRAQVVDRLRAEASPRHVPDEIIAVPVIPHTRTGKKLEVPVKRLLQGEEIGRVANPDAMDSFAALEHYLRYVRG